MITCPSTREPANQPSSSAVSTASAVSWTGGSRLGCHYGQKKNLIHIFSFDVSKNLLRPWLSAVHLCETRGRDSDAVATDQVSQVQGENKENLAGNCQRMVRKTSARIWFKGIFSAIW